MRVSLDLPLLPIVAFDLDVAAKSQGLVVLRDLVGLVEVGVEVVLSRKLGLVGDRTIDRFCHFHGILDNPLVEDGHGTGEPEADRTDVSIWPVIPVIGRAAAEELALCIELAVNFEAHNNIGVDHGFTTCSYA